MLRMRRRDPAGRHSAAGWRVLTFTAGFAALWSLVGIWQTWRPYAALTLLIAVASAFIGGYCYRQQVLASGQPPRFRWLVLKEDLPPEPPA